MSPIILLLLMARLPIYIYVIYKAYKLRKSIVLINSMAMGYIGFFGLALALVNSFDAHVVIRNLIGTLFSFAFFYLAITAKKLIPKD